MTKEPEIVGYKGRMFQIKNENIPDGQATFKITDIRKDNSLIDIHYAETITELNELKEKFNKSNASKEIKAILNRLIEDKKEIIKQINNICSFEKLKEFINKKELDNAVFEEYNHKYLSSVIHHKIKALQTNR